MNPIERLREQLTGETIPVSVVLAALDEQADLDDEHLARMTRIREAHYTDDDGRWCLEFASGIAEDMASMLHGALRDVPNYVEIMVNGTDTEIEARVGVMRFSVVYLRPGAKSVGELHREEKARAERLQALLDAETGRKGPGGWAFDGTEWTDGIHRVQRVYSGPMQSWSYLTLGWTTGKYFSTALEAMEAADGGRG